MEDEKITKSDLLSMSPLQSSIDSITEQIVKEDDLDETKRLVQLFNLNQKKKDVVRASMLYDLQDKVFEHMADRFNKRPGEFNNEELMSYYQALQNAIDRKNKSLDLVSDVPAIQINQINVSNTPEVSRESKEKVIRCVQEFLSKINSQSETTGGDSEILVEYEQSPLENVLKGEDEDETNS